MEISIKEQLKEIRSKTGLNRKEFAAYLEIPYRTMTDWERGERQMPDYLLKLIRYKVEVDLLMSKSRDSN